MSRATGQGARPDVSYVVTVYNKVPFLPAVIGALASEGGAFARDYLFVDDGSTDRSAALIEALLPTLPGPARVKRQENAGASAATNAGVAAATGRWIRLVDGDDLVAPGSTAALIAAAESGGFAFAYGDLGTYDPDAPAAAPVAFGTPEPLAPAAGLARFIRNCPANSSSILVERGFYRSAGGCDETLVSPDQMLFLRLFATGGGAHLPGPVALVPHEAAGRLSGEVRRSRYESVLALLALVEERPDLAPDLRRRAYRRALARANTYARLFGEKRLTSVHYWRYLASKIATPADPRRAMRRALAAFTEDGTSDRPAAWRTGAVKRGIARARLD